MCGMFSMTAASSLVSIGSSPVRILASNRFSAVARRSRLAPERDGMTSTTSVGSGDPWMIAANLRVFCLDQPVAFA